MVFGVPVGIYKIHKITFFKEIFGNVGARMGVAHCCKIHVVRKNVLNPDSDLDLEYKYLIGSFYLFS